MAVKDKLVTLEDLAQLKNWVKGSVDMWQDITSTLTWSNATWLPGGTTKQTQGVQIATVKVAKIAVTKGDRFRFTSWLTTAIPLNNGGSTSYGSAMYSQMPVTIFLPTTPSRFQAAAAPTRCS